MRALKAGCWLQSAAFNVQPVFKANSTGEKVLYVHPFALYSVEAGRYLGVAPQVAPADSASHAAGLQPGAMSFVGLKWADSSWNDTVDVLCGGMVVEFNFFEYDAFLSVVHKRRAGGWFADWTVHACLTCPDSKYDTRILWRVEMDFCEGCPGARISPQHVVRLRHFSSGLYLCRVEGEVQLTEDNTDNGARWQIAVQATTDTISFRDSQVL